MKPFASKSFANVSTAFALLLGLGAGEMAHSATESTPSQTVTAINAIALVERANQLYQAGETGKALLLYRKAEVRGADAATVSFNIGNCLFRLGRLSESAAAFRKTLRQTEGDYLPAQFNLAAVLFRLKEFGPAIAAYRRALARDPENAGAWLYLADAYVRTGDAVGSLQALEKARALEPDDVSIVYQKAEIHAALKEWDKAVELISEAYSRKPEETDFLFYRGDLQRAQDDLTAAAASYREGLGERPNDTDAMYKLADVLAQDGKAFLAMDWLQKALAVKPGYSDAAVFLGNLAFDAQWWDRAETAYADAMKAGNREGLEGLRNLAYEFHTLGRNDRAAEVLEKALGAQPKNVELKREVEQYRGLM
jgi:tetratricopeptide (TPR) repeat protein